MKITNQFQSNYLSWSYVSFLVGGYLAYLYSSCIFLLSASRPCNESFPASYLNESYLGLYLARSYSFFDL